VQKRITIGEFINEAKRQGCLERLVGGTVFGPRGQEQIRYLVAPGDQGCIQVIPNASEDAMLSPDMLAQYVRTLGLSGFDDLLPEWARKSG
jgi:hypothetical protein